MTKTDRVAALPAPEVLWRCALDYRGIAVPLLSVQAGRVLFSCQQLGAVDQATGALEWLYPFEVKSHLVHNSSAVGWVSDHEAHVIDGERGEPDRSFSCPAPDGRTLSVEGNLLVQGFDPRRHVWRLICFDLENDRCRWEHVEPDLMFGRVSIAAGRDLVLLGLSTGVLRALSLDTGTPLWERAWPDEGPEDDARPTYVGQPFLYQDRTIVQAGHRTVALELAGGNTVWESSTAGSAILHDDRLVGFDREGYWVVDAANGALALRRDVRPLAPELDQPGRICAVADGFAILSMPGVIAGLEIETGKPAWLLRYKGDQATILAANGRLFVASDARRLMAFSLPRRGNVAQVLPEEAAVPGETQVSSSEIVAEIKAGLARRSKAGAGADLKALKIVQLAQLLLERQIWLDEATPMEEMEAYPLVTDAERELEARGAAGLPGWQWLLAILQDSGHSASERAAAMLLLRSSPIRQLAVPEIIAALTHPEWQMRHTAIMCVRPAGAAGPETIQLLRELADSDPEARVRSAARSTLRRLQPK